MGKKDCKKNGNGESYEGVKNRSNPMRRESRKGRDRKKSGSRKVFDGRWEIFGMFSLET